MFNVSSVTNENAVPSISFTVPASSFAILRSRICLATPMICSREILPSCTAGPSRFRIRMLFKHLISAANLNYFYRCFTVQNTQAYSNTQTFQSIVFFWISSPIFFSERPKGPTLGAKEDAEPTSPPTTRIMRIFSSFGSIFGGMMKYVFLFSF